MKANYKGYRGKLLIMAVLVIVLQVCLALHVTAEQSETEEIMERQIKSGEVQKVEDELQKYSEDGIKEIIEGYDPEKIMDNAARGKFQFNLADILKNGMLFLFKELYLNIHILIKLVILAVICAVLKNLQTSFLSDSVGELAFYTCYVFVASVILISFNSALQLGVGIIDRMVDFMHATVPVLITLLVSGGNITSGGVFQPILIMIVQISATIIKSTFIPLILLSAVISLIDNISDTIRISRVAALLRQITGWGLGIILTLFVAVVSIQGALGAVVDGVASKTAKFALGAFIPIAGKYLADAADAVIGCTLLIKNAAGIAAMIGVIAICIVPLLKIVALIALYKITCMLIEPISEKRITNIINEISGSMAYILGIAASVAFMFLISITAIISASNLSAMIR